MTDENIGRITANDIDRAMARVQSRAVSERFQRRDRLHDRDPWVHAVLAMWCFGWGGFELGQGSWVGWLLLAGGIAWSTLAAWGLRWRWRSDLAWRDL